MKNAALIAKILAALAALVGVAYLIATYGEQIVAWAKKLLGKCECLCSECTCECDADCDECPCEEDCDACPCECCCECEEEVVEEAAEEAPAEESPAEAAVAEEADFEG